MNGCTAFSVQGPAQVKRSSKPSISRSAGAQRIALSLAAFTCLRIFLRGPQHIVICPARGLDPFRLPTEWQQKFKRGELLIISPFDSSIRRPTKETAEIRTRLVLSLAQSKTIIHASPGGFLRQLIASDRSNSGLEVSSLPAELR